MHYVLSQVQTFKEKVYTHSAYINNLQVHTTGYLLQLRNERVDNVKDKRCMSSITYNYTTNNVDDIENEQCTLSNIYNYTTKELMVLMMTGACRVLLITI